MADGTYQLTGPASAAQGRTVIYTAAAQQKGGWDNVASLTTAFADENANFTMQAGSNSVTLTVVVSGTSTPLSVAVSGNDVTVNVATDASGNPTSTASQVISALRASSAFIALGGAVNKAYGSNGSGTVLAVSKTNLSGAGASTRGTVSSAPLPKQHPDSNSYN